MSWNEPHRPRCSSQLLLKSASFGLADAIGLRNAHRRTDDYITRPKPLIEVRTHGHHANMSVPNYNCAFPRFRWLLWEKANTFPRPRSRDTMYTRLSAIIMSRIPRPSTSTFPWLRLSRQYSVIVQQLPCNHCILHSF